jgi:hypothetical protein
MYDGFDIQTTAYVAPSIATEWDVQPSLNAYITNYSTTAIRGTGVGWSQVVGRLGSLAGSHKA